MCLSNHTLIIAQTSLKKILQRHCHFVHAWCSFEEVVPLLSELICLLPGKEACLAICATIDVYSGTKQFLKEQGQSTIRSGFRNKARSLAKSEVRI